MASQVPPSIFTPISTSSTAPMAVAPAAGLGSTAAGASTAPMVGMTGQMAAAPPNTAGQAANPAASFPIDLTKINPYIYVPSFSMAIVGSMAFLLSGAIHTVQLIKTRSWYFLPMQNAPLIVAASLIARTQSVLTLSTTGATGPFIIFMILDMITGTLVSIGTIFTYTRVMWFVTPDDKRNFKTLWSPPMWTSLFWGFLLFIGDATKTVAQNFLMQTSPLSVKIQLIAQIYQFFVLSAFTFCAYRFMMMSKRWVIHGECEEKNWRRLGWTVVLAASILTTRQIFTIVQLDARADPMGFYSQHEWVYWATEEFPLFVVFALFSLSYPGYFLPREYIGFRIKLKEIAKAKRDNSWPLTISPPFPMPPKNVDDKYSEVTLAEMEEGKRY